jgi:hypothetical protein
MRCRSPIEIVARAGRGSLRGTIGQSVGWPGVLTSHDDVPPYFYSASKNGSYCKQRHMTTYHPILTTLYFVSQNPLQVPLDVRIVMRCKG